jgi:hypothetical protein
VIRLRPAAAREFAADFRHYANDYPGRGDRFVAAVDLVLRAIADHPERFPLLQEPDIRSAKVKRFPYRVVYMVVGADIDVIAVAHAKRRPAYWRRRLQ